MITPNNFPSRVSINDVVVRDGFQSEPSFVPTETKISLINRLSRTGLAKIEITSFVSPKAVPNLRDAEDVCQRITRVPEVSYVALVPNLMGCERTLSCEVFGLRITDTQTARHVFSLYFSMVYKSRC